MESLTPIVLSWILVIFGILIIILGFFRNFGRQIQKIKLQKFGVDLEVSTMSLWLLLGFSLTLGGAYPIIIGQREMEKYDARFFLIFPEGQQVNVADPSIDVKGHIKKNGAVVPIPVTKIVGVGGLFVQVKNLGKEDPFFVTVRKQDTPLFQSRDFQPTQAHLNLYPAPVIP